METIRKTKIICTIGPASGSLETLKKMMLAGMNVARINFSHGSGEEQDDKVSLIKKLRKELNLPVSLLLDTKGPEIRIGKFKEGKIITHKNDTFTLYNEDKLGDNNGVSISYKELYSDIKIGGTILIDDGLIKLEVIDISNKDIICKVINEGPLSNNKSVNVPDLKLHLPSLTQKDIDDIKYGIENEFDYIAASFIRKVDDVLAIRKILKENNCDHIKIISKIENREGIDNFDEILKASDGIMVARGDLGVEIDMEEVPVLQKAMIKKTYAAGKVVITATQMLESMIHNPSPTRAEVSDVANAIYDGTSAIMLSGETATGINPIECIKVMDKIAKKVEGTIKYWKRFSNREFNNSNFEFIIDHSMCVSAMNTNAKAIACYTITGDTPSIISSFRPLTPIYALTKDRKKFNQMGLIWGVNPKMYEGKENKTRTIIVESLSKFKNEQILNKDDIVIIAGGKYTYDEKYQSEINKSIGGIYKIN